MIKERFTFMCPILNKRLHEAEKNLILHKMEVKYLILTLGDD
jgi:hypothetical protein